jgi:hypothetical protein
VRPVQCNGTDFLGYFTDSNGFNYHPPHITFEYK